MVRKRSPVRVWLGAPARPVGEVVNTPAFHAGMQGFESPTGHQTSWGLGKLASPPTFIRTVSSAGRAPALQAGGRRFEPVTVHHRLGNTVEGYQSGQMGRTVNPLAYAFVGSNPTPSTNNGE
jgi:hypothetical protein